MRLEIERNATPDGLKRELWLLDFQLDKGLRLSSVHHQARASKRHKWKDEAKWDHMDERSYNSKLERPRTLPTSVREAALEQIVQAVRNTDIFIGWYNYGSQVR